MSKHTPGPWISKNNEVFSKKGEGICVPYTIGDCDAANAKLIAAAPDLFTALENLVNRFLSRVTPKKENANAYSLKITMIAATFAP